MLIVFLHSQRRRVPPHWYTGDELPATPAGVVEDTDWFPRPQVQESWGGLAFPVDTDWVPPIVIALEEAEGWPILTRVMGLPFSQVLLWPEDALPITPSPLSVDDTDWVPPVPWPPARWQSFWSEDDIAPSSPPVTAVDDEGWTPPVFGSPVALRSFWPPDEWPLPPGVLDEPSWQPPQPWGVPWATVPPWSPEEFGFSAPLGLEEEGWRAPLLWPSWRWAQSWVDDEGYPTPAVPFFLVEEHWQAPRPWAESRGGRSWEGEQEISAGMMAASVRGRVIPMQRANQSLQLTLITMRRA